MISPLFEKFAASSDASKIAFYKVDVDEQEQISQEVGIKAMPTFLFFQNGKKLNEVVGANPQQLQASLYRYTSVRGKVLTVSSFIDRPLSIQ